MIGNDVIDLKLAKLESNPFRKGYLEKTCTIREQDYIRKHPYPEFAFWVLWSRKEAVYKILLQQGRLRGYYPVRIENICPESGWVVFLNTVYFTKTFCNGDSLHTIALRTSDFDSVIELDTSIPLWKKGDIPFMKQGTTWLPVSKSHHGRFQKIVTQKSISNS
ncbi:MAG: 4'-phosphopantetheinyl transferase superfamily protein [Flavobacterium sp.]